MFSFVLSALFSLVFSGLFNFKSNDQPQLTMPCIDDGAGGESWTNFVTPIDKVFPSPFPNVFINLNLSRDISLYRRANDSEIIHVWSIGRFKSFKDLQWSPNGQFLAVQCANKCFIYCAENGKKTNQIALESTVTCRWIGAAGKTSPQVLMMVDDAADGAGRILWNVDGEFMLPESRLQINKESGAIVNVQIATEAGEFGILQGNGVFSRFPIPFNSFSSSMSVSDLARLSRGINVLNRVLDDLSDHFGKLLKLQNAIYCHLGELDTMVRNLLLSFEIVRSPSEGASETEITEWKGSLKKQHAELLVQMEDACAACKSFISNFPEFVTFVVERFQNEFLVKLETHSRAIQHDLAILLVLLESTATSSAAASESKSGFSDARALEILGAIKSSSDETKVLKEAMQWRIPFQEFQSTLQTEFKNQLQSFSGNPIYPLEMVSNVIIDLNSRFFVNAAEKTLWNANCLQKISYAARRFSSIFECPDGLIYYCRQLSKFKESGFADVYFTENQVFSLNPQRNALKVSSAEEEGQ